MATGSFPFFLLTCVTVIPYKVLRLVTFLLKSLKSPSSWLASDSQYTSSLSGPLFLTRSVYSLIPKYDMISLKCINKYFYYLGLLFSINYRKSLDFKCTVLSKEMRQCSVLVSRCFHLFTVVKLCLIKQGKEIKLISYSALLRSE